MPEYKEDAVVTDINELLTPTLPPADTIHSAINAKMCEPANESVADAQTKAALHMTCESLSDDQKPMLEAQDLVSEVSERTLNMQEDASKAEQVACFMFVMNKLHDSPLFTDKVAMEELLGHLLVFLQLHANFQMTLKQCKVVVRHSDLSDINDYVHGNLMEEIEQHYPGDKDDFLDVRICQCECLRD